MSKELRIQNHEVTKSLLKRWKSPENKLWVFDIENQKLEPRSLEATFAIENYLYVPRLEGELNDSTEKWFAGTENELAAFLQRLDSKNYEKPIKQQKLFLTLLALVGLSHRSSYELNRYKLALESDERLRLQLGIDLSTPELRHLFVVENMINTIDQQVRRFSQGNVTIVFGTSKKLLISDRPGAEIGFVQGGLNFIPVGPNEYVFMDATVPGLALTKGAQFSQSNANDGNFIETINQHTINGARKWVVAQSKDELEQVIPQLSKEKVETRAAKEKIEFTPLSEEQRKSGWILKKEDE